jgi:glycosyltransferase involved in cell wall biosynthesis
MRVLHVVHGFPPASTAGVEVYTARLAAALVRRGWDARVLTAAHDLGAATGSLRRRSLAGIEVTEVVNTRERPGLDGSYADPVVARGCLEVLREVRPDVVHVQHLLNLSWEVVDAARAMGAAVVMTLHDYWASCPRDGIRMRADGALCESVDHAICARCLRDSPYAAPAAQRGLLRAARSAGLGRALHALHDAAPRLSGVALRSLRAVAPGGGRVEASDLDERAARLRAVLRSVDALVAPTRFAARRAVEAGAPEPTIRVIPLGVDLARVERRGPARRFGYVGGLSDHKGVHVLVEAFRGLGDAELRLEIHGDASVHPECAVRLRGLAAGDARIRLCGRFPEGDQARVLAGLDVVVVPSLWWENSPIALLEARASGARVVASRTGGIPELLPETAGRLVPPGDVAALRAALAAEAVRPVSDVPPPRRLDDEVAELEALYATLPRTRVAPARKGARP